MLSKRKCHAQPREMILRGIYNDNLRMAGKPVKEDPPHGRTFLSGRSGWVFWILFSAAFCLFPDLGSSLSSHGELPLTSIPAVSPDITAAASVAQAAAVRSDAIERHRREALYAFIPEHKVMDYSLLFSPDDRVRLLSLFGLDIKTIVIDPGHGGADPGAIGAAGTREKDITLDIALKLAGRLRDIEGYNVLLTRKNDRTISLSKRVEFARQHHADLFISVHVNSLPNESVNVVETYYFGPPLNSETLWLAEQENKGSDYTIGELTSIVQDIGNTVKRQESIRLAKSIQKNLYRNVRRFDAQVLDVGVKMAPFVVLAKSDIPSVLVEIACLTNVDEEVKLASAEHRDRIAVFLREGIVEYLKVVSK